MAKKKPIKDEPLFISFETYNSPGSFTLNDWKRHDEPSAFNGFVQIKKYKITVEEIIEPVDVYWERLIKLWRMSTNYHHYRRLTI